MTKQKTTQRCTGPECDRDAKVKGLCSSHYAQKHSGRKLTVLRPRKSKKVSAPIKLLKRSDSLLITVKPPTPKAPVKRIKREPLHGMREWICPKCLSGGKFLGTQASHRCTSNKNLITDWVLKENYKPAVEPNL